MGINTSWCVMQAYFEENTYKSLPNAMVILPFVGTIGMVFLNLMGAPAQILNSRIGCKFTLAIGTLCKGLGLIIAGWCNEPWQLILAQSVVFGIGASISYVVAMSSTPPWFKKRRSLAIGIVASGSGVGGVIFPLIMQPMNAKLGPAWTYRILGFVVLALDSLATVLIRERDAPKTRVHKGFRDIFHFDVIKDVNFVLFCVGSVIGLLGYFVPYFFLPSYASYIGLSDAQGSALIAVSSACNFFGRVLIGYIADRIGKINTNVIFTVLGGLSCFLIWTFAWDYGTLMAFAAVFGLTCCSYFALLSPITMALVGAERFPSALSFLLLTNIISVFGPNIASAVEQGVGQTNPYFSYKMFGGVCYILGAIVLIILKFRLDRRPWAVV
ncbi:major facilitator superfamily domain-containing protein [Gongronella butleri]|nr:major facilitator superfamily domain-containing protein [Gongronella butleri]